MKSSNTKWPLIALAGAFCWASVGCASKPKNQTTMKTLEEHNREAIARFPQQVYEARNGIKCPKCSEELFDDLTRVLTSNPPQTPVFCKKCGYTGSRF
jgi:hypothetical protein